MRRLLAILVGLTPAVALADAPPSVLVTTELPKQGVLPHTLTAYGVVQAAPGGSEALSVLRAGQVSRVLVAVGQSVRQGAPLLTISADPASVAAYRQAVAAVTLTRGERARTAQMLSQHLATNDQLALTDKAVIDAQTTLDALDRAGGGTPVQTLTAPFDGVVSALGVASGARVAAQAPLLTLDRARRLVAAVGIEPAVRTMVTPGQAADVQPLDGGAAVAGHVVSVGAMLDPVARLVTALIEPQDVADQAGGLLPGGAVRVAVRVGDYRGWVLPRDAVLTDEHGVHVFQVDAGKAIRAAVTIVGTVGDRTVVSGPLDPARKLVTSGNYELQPSNPVHEAADAAAAAQ